ncbi:MAG: DNA alkylation repair protein, partial [Bdellovibrionales bacterium]|nr:DNA alkylation repair protein [Bdellovibrionales bacterium]
MKDDSFNTNYLAIHKELMALKNPKVAKSNQRFFKTEKGDYGEGDLFIGLRVPDIRRIAKKHILLKLSDVKKLIRSKYHEERLAGLILMVMQYQKSNNDIDKKKIFDAYLDLFPYINNWDLVDTSCYKIIGPHLENKRRRFLYQWAKSENLWTRRISIITTLWFIRKGDLEDSFALAKIHLN